MNSINLTNCIGVVLMAAVTCAASTVVITGLCVSTLVHFDNFLRGDISRGLAISVIIGLPLAATLGDRLFRLSARYARKSFANPTRMITNEGFYAGLIVSLPMSVVCAPIMFVALYVWQSMPSYLAYIVTFAAVMGGMLSEPVIHNYKNDLGLIAGEGDS